MAFTPVKEYRKALKEAGIPCTSFAVDFLKEEYKLLTGLGVQFSMEPKVIGPVMMAVLDDTYGNKIQLVQRL